eukprot:3473368-Alexandrium_andersonii.AAC.1
MGRRYYEQLRQAYNGASGNSEAELKVKDDTESIQGPLLKAMVALKSRSQNRQPLLGWLSIADAVNQRELVGVLKVLKSLRPSASAEQLRAALDIMRFVSRLGLPSRFPEEIKLCHKDFDEVLCQASSVLRIQDGSSMSPSILELSASDCVWCPGVAMPFEGLSE